MDLPINYNQLNQRQRKVVREQYVLHQEGKCHYCKAPLDGPPTQEVKSKRVYPALFPPGFFRNPVHLHHNHDTGMTIGAVHCYCNAVLWQYHNE